MKKEVKTLFLILLFVVFLGYMAYRQFSQFQRSDQQFSLPDITMLKPENLFPEEEKGEKEFVSPDGKLKIKYPASWREGGEELLKAFNQGRDELTEEKTIFSAFKATWQDTLPSYLLITEVSLSDPEKILEKIKGGGENSQTEIEISEIEKDEKKILFEAVYKSESPQLSLHSREKIISLPEKSYIISVITLGENWEEISSDAIFILDSVEIIER